MYIKNQQKQGLKQSWLDVELTGHEISAPEFSNFLRRYTSEIRAKTGEEIHLSKDLSKWIDKEWLVRVSREELSE